MHCLYEEWKLTSYVNTHTISTVQPNVHSIMKRSLVRGIVFICSQNGLWLICARMTLLACTVSHLGTFTKKGDFTPFPQPPSPSLFPCLLLPFFLPYSPPLSCPTLLINECKSQTITFRHFKSTCRACLSSSSWKHIKIQTRTTKSSSIEWPIQFNSFETFQRQIHIHSSQKQIILKCYIVSNNNQC